MGSTGISFFMCRGWLRNEVGYWTVGGLDMGRRFWRRMADMFGSGSRRNTNTSFNPCSFVTDIPLAMLQPVNTPTSQWYLLVTMITSLAHSAEEEMSFV